MVHLFSVSQLMDDYIVQNSLRGEDKSPVEVQVAGAAAAPPSGLLFPDGDPAVSHAHDTGVVCRLLREYGPGGLHVMFPFLFRQRRAGWGRMRPGFFEMFYHPVLFTADKRIDEGTGTAVWSRILTFPSRVIWIATVLRRLYMISYEKGKCIISPRNKV